MILNYDENFFRGRRSPCCHGIIHSQINYYRDEISAICSNCKNKIATVRMRMPVIAAYSDLEKLLLCIDTHSKPEYIASDEELENFLGL